MSLTTLDRLYETQHTHTIYDTTCINKQYNIDKGYKMQETH